LNYLVGSSGALTIKQPTTALVGIATGTVPSGVTVDPCNRFVYVSNGQPNNTVSGYTVCNNLSLPLCPEADFSLHPIAGSPFAAGNAPGPLTEDAFAKYLYVINVQGNSISPFAINTSSGVLTPLTPAPIATNIGPTAISVRGDDTWLFVSNITSANISEYAITTSTGQLTPQPTVDAFPLPYGIAVK
jgi:6-phosphogluconolactonase (cycloisomerase 2 family)